MKQHLNQLQYLLRSFTRCVFARTGTLLVLLTILLSCSNNPKVKSASSSARAATAKSKGLGGQFSGFFEAVEYKQEGEPLVNKITLIIDSLTGQTIWGHSVVAGNRRPFKGNYAVKDSIYTVTAAEPGTHKYDGTFRFTLDAARGTLTGTWNAFDKNTRVTVRKYELERQQFRYEPANTIPMHLVGEPIYDTWTDEEKAETLTEDAVKLNASARELTTADIENVYKADLEVIRNAIYARHGYSFRNTKMRTIFDGIDWYLPLYTDVTAKLTAVEKKNIALLKRYEGHAERYYDSYGR